MTHSAQMPEKLPVWQIVLQTYGFVFGNLGALFRVGLIPMAVYGALIMLIQVDLQTEEFRRIAEGEVFVPISGLTGILFALPVLLFATAWHRYSISRDPAMTGVFSLRLGKAELVFLGYGILVYAMIFIAGIAIGIVGGVLAAFVGQWFMVVMVFAVIAVMSVFLIRLTLVFPAAAIGATAGIKDSWRATRGSFWRILAITFLVLLPIGVVSLIVATTFDTVGLITGHGSAAPDQLEQAIRITSFINLLSYWIYIGISIGALSFIYKFLAGKDIGEPVDLTVFR